MRTINRNSEQFVRAQKRVKDMVGFYTHLISTVLIVPFVIFINLNLVPQFEWFWFFIGAWILGLTLHWVNVFGLSKLSFHKDWEERKIKEFMGSDSKDYEEEMEQDHSEELRYVEVKKRIEEIKGFYWHLAVSIFAIPMIIWVNFKFVPEFTFFWYAVGGMVIGLFFHWLGIFGLKQIGLGKDWEERKIKELLRQNNNNTIN